MRTRITGVRRALSAFLALDAIATIASGPRASRVSLEVVVEATGLLDGMLLKLGGSRCLQRRYAYALGCLGARLVAGGRGANRAHAREHVPHPALEPAA